MDEFTLTGAFKLACVAILLAVALAIAFFVIELLFRHACNLGLEGIASKRKGSPYRSGRAPD